jgi:hypothetical protein
VEQVRVSPLGEERKGCNKAKTVNLKKCELRILAAVTKSKSGFHPWEKRKRGVVM